jgi:hypothetical protein
MIAELSLSSVEGTAEIQAPKFFSPIDRLTTAPIQIMVCQDVRQ